MNDAIPAGTLHESMANHPEQLPPRMYLYHRDHAPRGKDFPLAEGEAMLGKDGWVDSPAKLKKDKDLNADNDNAKQEAEKAGEVMSAARAELAKVPEWGPGAFPAEIEQTAEGMKSWKRVDLEDFILNHKLMESISEDISVADLKKQVAVLIEQHNYVIQQRGIAEDLTA